MLYSDARADHTALASHWGESSVNGDILPVIYPSALCVVFAVHIPLACHKIPANAQSNAVRVPMPLAEPDQNITHATLADTTEVPARTHAIETINDKEATVSQSH